MIAEVTVPASTQENQYCQPVCSCCTKCEQGMQCENDSNVYTSSNRSMQRSIPTSLNSNLIRPLNLNNMEDCYLGKTPKWVNFIHKWARILPMVFTKNLVTGRKLNSKYYLIQHVHPSFTSAVTWHIIHASSYIRPAHHGWEASSAWMVDKFPALQNRHDTWLVLIEVITFKT